MEVAILEQINDVLRTMRENKPQERGEHARAWAVAITEMEKVESYWAMQVLSRKQIIEAIELGVI